MSSSVLESVPGHVEVFTTLDVPIRQRRDLWEQHNARALIGLECTTADDRGIRGTETTMALSSSLLAAVEGAAQVASRTDTYLRTHPVDAVAVYMMRRGSGFFYHPGGFDLVAPGDVVVVDADRPYIHGFSTDSAEYVFHLPRALASEYGIQSSLTRALVARPDGELRTLVHRALARKAGDLFSGHTVLSAAAEQSLLGSLSGVVGQSLPFGSFRLDAAMEHIESHALDPSLDAESVAAAVHLSRRQLARVFEESGRSISHTIRHTRLAAGRSLLEAEGASLTVAEVARRSGFSSPSNFARAFRGAYGMSPREAQAGTSADGIP